MYANTGYIREPDNEIEVTNQPFSVSGCGIYRLIRQSVMTTQRPEGRRDYQLLYVSSGKAFFFFDGEELIAPAGSMVLYRPGESQRYSYYAKDNPEVYWIHFSGFEASGMLDKIGFSESHMLSCGISSNYAEIFSRIILELQLKRPCFEELLRLLLQELFYSIMRSQLESSADRFRHREEMEDCVRFFNESFSQEISIEEYAKNQHMSVCWFIRCFKRYMGVTPMQYLTSIRIGKAKELLKNTNYSIQEISNLVGYENPLYFSRIFHRQTGHSPSAYRKEL